MGRYFVALNGSWTRIVYVIAEVVREPNDDGYDRDLSIAANVAGSRAIIVTEEELRALPGGRVAMEHWRSGNDNSFVLDTMAQDSDMASLQEELDPRPAWTLEEAHRVVARSRQRSREMLDDSAAAREASLVIRTTLKETLEAVQEQRSRTASLLDEIGKQMHRPARPATRRHLRSVS